MAQPVFRLSFRRPPRMTDVALPTDNKCSSRRKSKCLSTDCLYWLKSSERT